MGDSDNDSRAGSKRGRRFDDAHRRYDILAGADCRATVTHPKEPAINRYDEF